MRNIYGAFLFLLASIQINAQTTIFTDDFESGTAAWTLTGQWATTTAQAYNGSNSLTDSPGGLYLNQQTTTATITQSFDLSSALDANVYFKMKYDIENGFDYCYVDVSSNNGTSWTVAETINGENNLTNWTDLTVNIGGFVGNSQVKVRWRLFTDQGYQSDGIYIDSLRITSDTIDNAAPLIIHEPLDHYEGAFGVNQRLVTITDISGVATAEMYYNVDGGAYSTIYASDTVGESYLFDLPPADAGAFVDYYVLAVDSSAQSNSALSETFKYVSGNYLKYEEGIVDFIQSYSTVGFNNVGTAMRMTIEQPTTITTALIGNYTDINNPNDSMEFHVWEDNNGEPGADLIAPIMVYPAANLAQPYLITRIDLRPYASQLDSLSGDVFIGFFAPDSNVWVTVTDTLATSGDRVMNFNGTNWTSQNDFYQFRIITDTAAPIADFSFDNTNDPTIDFTDETANFPTAWDWDFGDGNTSALQDPSHTYAVPGIYNVCLVASNTAGADSICKLVVVANGPPVANFIFNANGDPEVDFFDATANVPTSWSWDFDDGNTSTIMNPTHTFGDTGMYEVCLTAANAYGSDDTCKTITIEKGIPVANFIHNVVDDTIVNFTDLSSLSPTQWDWDFDVNGETSTMQSPSLTYPNANATYNVCLVASNAHGSSAPYCDEVEIEKVVGIEQTIGSTFQVYPNPASDLLTVSIDANANQVSYTLYDVAGQIIRSGQESSNLFEIGVAQLPAGMYFLEIKSESLSVSNFPIVIR